MVSEQSVVGKQLLMVEAVVKVFFHATHQHLHIRCAVVRGDTLSEATIFTSVLQRHHQLMACFERFECLGIHRMEVARIDERGINTLFGKQVSHILAFLIE